jgi:hypothetical protein
MINKAKRDLFMKDYTLFMSQYTTPKKISNHVGLIFSNFTTTGPRSELDITIDDLRVSIPYVLYYFQRWYRQSDCKEELSEFYFHVVRDGTEKLDSVCRQLLEEEEREVR